MIKVGWIDFNSKDREKAMAVIDLMKENGAVDELGIGVVRDRLADLLFPGTSTIQTRAKYFFIVPWAMMEAEKNFNNKEEYKRKLKKIETEVILSLIKNEESSSKGIIGRDAKEKLRTAPSSIYWNGLRSFNIMKLNISRNQYINSLEVSKKFVNEEGDDKDSFYLEDDKNLWDICSYDKNWKSNIKLSLSKEEALFLKGKIVQAHPLSLYAYLLQEEIDVQAVSLVSILNNDNLPLQIKENLNLALDFSDLIYGAHLRYNIILKKKNSMATREEDGLWSSWCDEMMNFDWKGFSEQRIYSFGSSTKGTCEFLKWWFSVVKDIENINLEDVDLRIENREYVLKGQRAKLKNFKDVNCEKWVGLGELNYRWPIVKNMLLDIKEGELV